MSSRSLGHRAPLLWLVVPLMAGLSLGHAGLMLPVGWSLALAVAAVSVAWIFRERGGVRWHGAIVFAMLCAGLASYALHRPRIAAWEQLPPREARLTIEIERVFAQKEEKRASGIARIAKTATHLQETRGQRVYFSLHTRAGARDLVATSQHEVIGVLAGLPRVAEMGTFEQFLTDAGVNYRVTRGRFLEQTRAPTAYRQFCANAATRLSAILGLGVQAKRPEFTGVYRAMLLGQQAELTEEQGEAFRRSGTMHIFSISGLHIAVIAGAIHGLLLLLRVPAKGRLVVGLVVLWLYVDVTGRAPSAVRAFIMVALVQTSLALRVPTNPVAALATSAWLVAVFDPLGTFSTSFRLSYAIVAALLMMGLPLAETLQRAWLPERDLPKIAWPWWRHVAAWCWRGLTSSIAIGFAISLVGTLCGVWYFQLLTPGALLLNLVFVPAASLAMIGGFVSLLLGLIGFDAGASLANHASVLLLALLDATVRGSVLVPGMWFNAVFRVSWVGGFSIVALLFAIGFGYAQGWQRASRGYWAPLAVVLVAVAAGVKLL
mgnify:CR=1 FL=1